MYRKTSLANGITVVTESIPYFSAVSLGLWWKTGGRQETEKNNGIAHFIEHMLFKGTSNRSAYDIAREIDAVGGTINAFTGKEYTCLYARVMRKDTDTALSIFADMYENSLFDAEEIQKEKHVITQEIKMIEDNPEEYIYDMFNAAYFKNHSLGMTILGQESNIEQFTREQLVDHFLHYYRPASLIVTAAGKVDHARFVEEIEALFGKTRDRGAETTELETPHPTKVVEVYEKDLEHVYLCIGTDGASQVDKRRYPLYVLNALMGGSMSSYLFQEIREKRGLVYNIYSYVNCYHDAGTFGISTSTSGEFTEEVLRLVKDEIRRIRDKGITDAELTFSKEHIKGNLFISLESSEARMGRLAKNEIYFNSYVPLKDTLREIDKIQKSQVNEIARSIFSKPDEISLTVLGNVDREKIENIWMN
jgi:predicted Zn-dependent peptidase